MKISLIVLDPMPDAERGTLEYAASAAASSHGVRADLSLEEARKLEAAIDMSDCHALRRELVAVLGEFQRGLEQTLDAAPLPANQPPR